MQLKVFVVLLISVFITVDCWGLDPWNKSGGRCANGRHQHLAPDGKPAICNPSGISPCCSKWGHCGNSNLHCKCNGCIDYRDYDIRVQKACPGGVVISGQCLVIYNEKVSWKEASHKCWSQSGMQYGSPIRLASLNDPKAFMDYAKVHHPDDILWLGGTDWDEEGKWYWHNGKPFGKQFPWVSGEPNNHDGNQHCLSWGGVTTNGYANYDDRTCTEEHKYVCEHY